MSKVWVVEKATLKPLRGHSDFSDPEVALASSARILRGLGATSVSVRNIPEWGVNSMLIYDQSETIPLAIVVEGAFISDGLLPLPPTEEVTGTDPDTPDTVYH